MTIGSIVFIGVGVIILIVGVALSIGSFVDQDPAFGVGLLLVALLMAALCIVSPIIYMQTEAGQRALKDQKSNFGDGIERTVTVYDINGEIIEKYSGKFDVETTSEYIIFDDENDKRHMIYYTTGTVIIDEK